MTVFLVALADGSIDEIEAGRFEVDDAGLAMFWSGTESLPTPETVLVIYAASRWISIRVVRPAPFTAATNAACRSTSP